MLLEKALHLKIGAGYHLAEKLFKDGNKKKICKIKFLIFIQKYMKRFCNKTSVAQ